MLFCHQGTSAGTAVRLGTTVNSFSDIREQSNTSWLCGPFPAASPACHMQTWKLCRHLQAKRHIQECSGGTWDPRQKLGSLMPCSHSWLLLVHWGQTSPFSLGPRMTSNPTALPLQQWWLPQTLWITYFLEGLLFLKSFKVTPIPFHYLKQ